MFLRNVLILFRFVVKTDGQAVFIVASGSGGEGRRYWPTVLKVCCMSARVSVSEGGMVSRVRAGPLE